MKKITLLFTFLIALGYSTYAQVSAYSFSQSVGTYTEITGGTIMGTSTTATSFDSQLWPIVNGSIPFNFNFNGTDYTGCSVNSNGYITFGATTSSAFTSTAISSTTAYSGAIAAWSGDLCGVFVTGLITGETRWEVVGTAPNREFVIQFKNWRPTYSSSTTSVPFMNFQIRLVETSNQIKVVYGANGYAIGSTAASGTRQIGLRGATNADFNNRLNGTTVLFNSSTAGTTNSSTQAYNTSVATPGMPTDGTEYSWMPPTPCTGTPVAGTVAPASQTLLTGQASAALVASGYTSGVSGLTFQWEESNDDGVGDAWANAVGGTGATTASYTPPVFASTIYYRLRVTCTNGGAFANTASVVLNACGSFTVPTLVDFSVFLPGCWQRADNGDLTAGPATFGTSAWVADGFGNVGTTGAIRINLDATGDNDWVLSPLYTIPATGYELKFDASANQWASTVAPTTAWESDDFVEVLVSTGTTAWTVLYTYNDTNVPSNTGTVNIIDLDAYSGQDVRFAFRGVEGATNGGADIEFIVDNFEIRMTPACIAPTTLSASNIGATSADLAWVDGSGGSQFDYEYIVQAAGTGMPVVAGTPFDISSLPAPSGVLTANTAYEFWVRADCGGSGFSTWVGPFNFTTTCAVFTAPYTQNFENAGAIPSCWNMSGSEVWRFSNTGTGNHIGNNGVITGTTTSGNYFAWIDDSSPDTANAELRSPLIDVSSLTVPRLTFFELSNNEGANPNSTLNVEVWDGAAWNAMATYNTNTVGGWEKRIIDLSGLTITGPVQARFIIIESASFYDDIAIDDVTIEETPSCLEPTTLVAANISATGVDLSWAHATMFDFEYVVQAAGTGVPSGSGVAVGALSVSVGSLTPATNYEVYIRTDCGGSYSTWAGPINFRTLCNPYTIPYFEGFESGYVQATSITGCLSQESITGTEVWSANTSLVDYNRTPRTGSWNAFLQYGNDDWIFIPIDLIGGTSYTVELYARQDGATSTDSHMLISYGTAGTSAGMTTSIVPSTGIINGNYQQISGVFTPATTGTYYVGIKGDMNFSPWYISLDDISINLTPACPAPTGVMASNITSTTADLSWTATTGNYEYVLDMVAADPSAAGTPLAGESYNATGLTASTTYYFHVRSDCGSAWTTISFTTLVSPPVNNDLCNAIPLTLGAATTGGDYTTIGATAQTNEPVPACFNGGINGSVWFSFVAPTSGSVEVTTDFAGGTLEDGDTEIAVYDATGVTCADLTTLGATVGCDQDSGNVNTLYGSFLTLAGLTSGTTYFIQVDTYGGVANGTFGIQVNTVLSSNSFDSNAFLAYPNPVKDVLNLEYNSEISSIKVMNLLGQEVISRNINANSTQVDMSQLSAGAYIVNVTVGNAVKTIKVVKQ